jgi:uncharacterized protein (TIGR03032 family)
VTADGPKDATPAASFESVHTSNLPALFGQARISLVVSTYQAGKVILIRREGESLNTHFRQFEKPMGIAVDRHRVTIGGTKMVWYYRNVPALAPKTEPLGRHDACYVPRQMHVTGDIDIHELAWDDADRLWVVNTRFSCLCTLDPDHSFSPRWRPGFVSGLAPEDRCHLNGLAMLQGKPKYVTALGATDSRQGWRDNKRSGGVLIDVEHDALILSGLCMPHSPRVHDGRLWFLNSGEGTLCEVDAERKTFRTVASVPGFARGLDFFGPLAFIGLSQVRESAIFGGLPLLERASKPDCGVWVVDIRNGQTVGFLRFASGVQEIFAVQILRGTLFPEMLEWQDPHVATTYVLPDAALSDVVR